MILQVLCAILAVLSFVTACDIPLKSFFDVTPGFPTVQICGRICISSLWMAPGNVRTVEFTGKLKDGEDPRKYFFYLFLDCHLTSFTN